MAMMSQERHKGDILMKKEFSLRRLFKLIEGANELYMLRGMGEPMCASFFIDDRHIGIFAKWEDFKKYAKSEFYDYELIIYGDGWEPRKDRTAEYIYRYPAKRNSGSFSILRICLF